MVYGEVARWRLAAPVKGFSQGLLFRERANRTSCHDGFVPRREKEPARWNHLLPLPRNRARIRSERQWSECGMTSRKAILGNEIFLDFAGGKPITWKDRRSRDLFLPWIELEDRGDGTFHSS